MGTAGPKAPPGLWLEVDLHVRETPYMSLWVGRYRNFGLIRVVSGEFASGWTPDPLAFESVIQLYAQLNAPKAEDTSSGDPKSSSLNY